MSRNQYLDKLKNQIEEWEYDLDRLEHRVDDIQEELKAKFQQTVADLKVKKEEMVTKAQNVEEATEDAFDDLKEGVELAWDSLKLGILAAKSEYIDKEKE